MPLISFITAVYNNPVLIKNAAKSVLEQSGDDIEYIIVDDGSTDNTPIVVDEIAAKDCRVRVLHQQNQWIYASFNNGIKIAKGEYIYILNSDDILHEGSYVRMKNLIKDYYPDVIWTKVLVHKCDFNQNILEYDYLHWGDMVKEDMLCSDKNFVHKAWPFFYTSRLAINQANLYKRELMLTHPFREDVYGADTLFNLNIARDINSCYVCSDAIYDFFEYPNNKNASAKKYYEYEHELTNDIVSGYIKLYKDFGVSIDEFQYLYAQRVTNITREIRMLLADECKLNLEDKIKKIFMEYIDELVYECAIKSKRIEELEGRVLSGIRELFGYNTLSEDSDYFFVYELVEILLRYEKTEEDYVTLLNSINNPINKYHIGLNFYNMLKTKID